MIEHQKIFYRIPFYFFLAFIFILPLSILTYFENPVDLLRSSMLKIFGTIFISALLMNSIKNFFQSKANFIVYFNRTLDTPVILFGGAVIISVIFSISPSVSIWGQYQRQFSLITYIYILLIYFSAFTFIQKETNCKTILRVFELSAVFASLYAFLQVAGIDPLRIQPPGIERPISTFGNPVFLGGFLVILFPFSILNISLKKSLTLRILCPVIILGGIIISGTRSAYIALFIEIIILILLLLIENKKDILHSKELKLISIISTSVFIIAVFYCIFYPDSFLVKRINIFIDFENNTRFILWRDSINVFTKYPITGSGVAAFSMAFEEFYSTKLRLVESSSYFDHPHNNFLNILYTMGVFGIVAYMLIIIQSIRICLRYLFNNGRKEHKMIYTSFLISIAGYCAYGLTNFDDLTIVIYFFVLISLIKSFDRNNIQAVKIHKIIFFIVTIPMFIFLISNAYIAINNLRADRFFKTGNDLIKQGNLTESLKKINKAIMLNGECTDYKFAVSYIVYRHCFSSENIAQDYKMNLLNQAASQIENISMKHYFKNECDALLSLIYYEMGKENEGILLENKVFSKDSVNITYRINLARYYMKIGNLHKAEELIELPLKLRPTSVDVNLCAAYLNIKMGNTEKARIYCEKVLAGEPQNKYAIKVLKEINNQDK